MSVTRHDFVELAKSYAWLVVNWILLFVFAQMFFGIYSVLDTFLWVILIGSGVLVLLVGVAVFGVMVWAHRHFGLWTVHAHRLPSSTVMQHLSDIWNRQTESALVWVRPDESEGFTIRTYPVWCVLVRNGKVVHACEGMVEPDDRVSVRPYEKVRADGVVIQWVFSGVAKLGMSNPLLLTFGRRNPVRSFIYGNGVNLRRP